MADKFGFGDLARKMKTVEKRFLTGGIKLAQKEMSENFSSESSKESRESWADLTYRTEPPPKLDLTGLLKRSSIFGVPFIFGNKATLVINPIDSRGRSYAAYHEDGIGTNPKREFVTQSNELSNKQVNYLILQLDKAFK